MKSRPIEALEADSGAMGKWSQGYVIFNRSPNRQLDWIFLGRELAGAERHLEKTQRVYGRATGHGSFEHGVHERRGILPPGAACVAAVEQRLSGAFAA